MDLRKVFDQTVRDIKREVNKKVLKIPEIEQKVLDATSNEPWGPHGALMADIAQATRNFNEFQMVMAILWKRLTDTGRNWRHVYKSLTVFEFLVAHGADRVTEELKEHTFQLQGLVDFQYVEPNGKDQGVNVRKKAQSLVALVNDKEKIREVRQKAAANRDKYQGFSSSGGIYKSTPHSNTGRGYSDWDDDRHSANGRYGGRDDRFGGSPEEDRYGRVGDRYTKENDRYRANLYHSDHDRDCNESRHGTRGFDYVDDKKEDDEGDLRNGVSRMPGGNRTAAYEEPYQKKYERDAKSFGAASTLNPPTTSQSKPLTTVQEDDDFNPRAPGSTVPAVPSSTEVDFFSQTDFLSTTTSSSAVEDLFTGQSFQSASSNSKNNVLNPRSDLFAPASDPFAPPASFATTNDFGAFSSAPTSDFSTLTSAPSSDFSAFTSAPSSDFSAFTSAPSSDFTAFTSAPSSDFTPFTPAPPSNTHIHGGGDLFGTDPFSSFGNLQSESKPLGNSGTFDAFESVPSHVAAPSFAAFEAVGNTSTVSQPPPSSFSATAASAKFEPKSSLWADSLSSGLIDLNIGAPKSNALAELGIQLDSSLGSDWTKEEKPQHSIKGKAMGAGTGLGRAGASGLPPPPPPNMGQGGGYGIGTAAPTSTGAGYFNMTPGAFMDTHQNGMNSMGVLPNQQQQFGGFRKRPP